MIKILQTYLFRKDIDKMLRKFLHVNKKFRKKINKNIDLSNDEINVIKKMQLDIITCIERNKKSIVNVAIQNFWETYNSYKKIEIKDTTTAGQVMKLSEVVILNIREYPVLLGLNSKELIFICIPIVALMLLYL